MTVNEPNSTFTLQGQQKKDSSPHEEFHHPGGGCSFWVQLTDWRPVWATTQEAQRVGVNAETMKISSSHRNPMLTIPDTVVIYLSDILYIISVCNISYMCFISLVRLLQKWCIIGGKWMVTCGTAYEIITQIQGSVSRRYTPFIQETYKTPRRFL